MTCKNRAMYKKKKEEEKYNQEPDRVPSPKPVNAPLELIGQANVAEELIVGLTLINNTLAVK